MVVTLDRSPRSRPLTRAKKKKVVKRVGRCRVCGCTNSCGCRDSVSGLPCFWVNQAEDLCSSCAKKGPS